ncbi:hypothetical protein HDU79_000704, partial [Rhizoclosmatium sp. JEL0117]
MPPGQVPGPGVATTLVVQYEGVNGDDLRNFCRSQGINKTGTNVQLIGNLNDRKENLDERLRRGLFGSVFLAIDPGAESIAWALILGPSLRRRNQENASFILYACGKDPLNTYNRTAASNPFIADQ